MHLYLNYFDAEWKFLRFCCHSSPSLPFTLPPSSASTTRLFLVRCIGCQVCGKHCFSPLKGLILPTSTTPGKCCILQTRTLKPREVTWPKLSSVVQGIRSAGAFAHCVMNTRDLWYGWTKWVSLYLDLLDSQRKVHFYLIQPHLNPFKNKHSLNIF